LSTSNADLVDVTSDLTKRLEDLEAYSRRENVIICGLPEGSFVESATRSADLLPSDTAQEGSSAAVENSVIAFCRDKLDIDLQPGDISSAHHMRKGDKDSTRPIIMSILGTNSYA